MFILGISCFYHDSACALIKDGEIVAAAQEERFTRIKHDSSFPSHSLQYCLRQAGIDLNEVEAIIYYDKPWLKLERIIETFYQVSPKGFFAFKRGIPVWLKQKFLLSSLIKDELKKCFDKNTVDKIAVKFSNHHLSHAASAFYPSPFSEAAVLTLDGVGEWSTSTLSYGQEHKLRVLSELYFPDSVGLLYSSFTQFCGFKVNSGEYKLMGLAPYGNKNGKNFKTFRNSIVSKMCKIFPDGSIRLNQDYFSYTYGNEMIKSDSWEKLFGLKPRSEEQPLTQEYCDLALAIQDVTEEIVILMAQYAKEKTGSDNLCLAGGVALNCVANTKILEKRIFKNIWIQPAAGDAGGALGAALAYYYSLTKLRVPFPDNDSMKGAYLGPEIKSTEIEKELIQNNIHFIKVDNEDLLCDKTAEMVSQGKIIGWFQGRMEFGPRALGGRSIIADPRNLTMQKNLNLKIKFRESFRPFAPSVLKEDLEIYFQNKIASPYMLLIDYVNDVHRITLPEKYGSLSINEKLNHRRTFIPAVTHMDFSARLQTVDGKFNHRYYKLLHAFKKKAGVGILINTSFNVRGEPIVCSVQDALKCFFQTDIDALVIGNYIVLKEDQALSVNDFYKNLKTAFAKD